ncbi:MAG: TRAP transporter fused permease subunit [Vicinamibacterales bacterium]|jgi:TRAP transporter 4TM/12TM fusion protein|nr:C4-dicarboxylate ABC transporter permease [Acidobacteriota bacterium]MDP6371193.1 TRAP transporter fused permease subunit [Vicinamibacterales bacterium]MDP6608258.1 TRAP transporter fused permease subunit [Vicinamibacterales bacterium]HAK54189.1 C4-dicarboxylate ABC transporter permease [Acidobacteriota bacterium]|tara:strand:+ start:14866 stop:16788 length:1923 start_codon:yes stop_codon:yes gene_type:complete
MNGAVVGRRRELPPWAEWAVAWMATGLIVVGGLYATRVHDLIGIAFFPQQLFGLVLGLMLAIVFLTMPLRRSRTSRAVPRYDIALALAGLACGLYVVIWFPSVAYELSFPTPDKYILGTIAMGLVLEACRRVYGPVLPTVTVVFVLYAALASHFPEFLETRSIPWSRLSTELYLGPEGMLGVALSLVATVVLVFILFGRLTFALGGGTVFTDIATALMGRYRGGPAKVAVLGSALFGSISGSAVANVAITGTVTIPMMKRIGYRPEVAGAIEAAASTGGLVTPPVMSVVAFLMAEYLGLPYGQVVIAATLPALLYFTAILVQVDLEAGRTGLQGVPAADIPRLSHVLRRGWPFLLPLPILIVTLIVFFWEPARAGMFSVLVLVASGYWFVRDKSIRWWFDEVARAGQSVAEILTVAAVVGLIMGSASVTGLGFTLSVPLLQLADTSLLLFLTATAFISIVLGTGLPGIAIYFMQVALIVPSLVDSGVPPLAAHFFIYYFGVFSFITPPVCIAAIAAASIAGAGPMRTGWEAVKLGVVAFVVPFVFVLSPSLLGQGEAWATAVDCVTALLGVVAISVGLRGFLVAPVGPLARAACLVAALGLFLPVDLAAAAWGGKMAGATLFGTVVGGHLLLVQRANAGD